MLNEELEKLSEGIKDKHTQGQIRVLARFGICGFSNHIHFSRVRHELEDIRMTYFIKDHKLIWLMNFNPKIVLLFKP